MPLLFVQVRRPDCVRNRSSEHHEPCEGGWAVSSDRNCGRCGFSKDYEGHRAASVEERHAGSGADMNRTAGTLEALGECDAVILVEGRGKSSRGQAQKEHESIAALEKPVVGYVML